MTMRTPRGFILRLVAGGSAVVALTLLAIGLERHASRPAKAPSELEISSVLGSSTGGAAARESDVTGSDPHYLRAELPRAFEFPADHAAHEGFRTEWWYVTGNLFARDGRAFGVQLTFFRNALVPPGAMGAAEAAGGSMWRSSHVWMAHFAVGDERRGRFRFAERFAREGADAALSGASGGSGGLAGLPAVPALPTLRGLAGVAPAPFRVALEDWSLSSVGQDFAPLRLSARDAGFAVDLTLDSMKPPVLQGDRGLSQKGPEPGNASYYYSLTRLATRGTLMLDGEAISVSGDSWLDREWSTSALGSDLSGWDWFALQLDDGREIMFYRLRRKDGNENPWSRGSIVAADGSSHALLGTDVALRVVSTWTNPAGAVYPARWHLSLPAEELELEIRPRLPDQELAVTVRYWEGAVAVTGSSRGTAIGGHGFVEMTGYVAPSPATR
ncbi:MAG: lipocalin-like domain-containing protein [Thermoanaerobaculia bacterium]